MLSCRFPLHCHLVLWAVLIVLVGVACAPSATTPNVQPAAKPTTPAQAVAPAQQRETAVPALPASTAVAEAEGRAPGEVRMLSRVQVGEGDRNCYRLGEADSAQDQSAGVPLSIPGESTPPPMGPRRSGYILWFTGSSFAMNWVRLGKVTVQVLHGAPLTPEGQDCGRAYLEGYTGLTFRTLPRG
jgi:hypothetical protein